MLARLLLENVKVLTVGQFSYVQNVCIYLAHDLFIGLFGHRFLLLERHIHESPTSCHRHPMYEVHKNLSIILAPFVSTMRHRGTHWQAINLKQKNMKSAHLRFKMHYVIPSSSDDDNTPHDLVAPIIKNRHPPPATAPATTVLSEPLVLW
jgi:hypothetical protein